MERSQHAIEGSGLQFTSDAQERLAALLEKAFDVVPFAADEACEEAGALLAKFHDCALANHETRKRSRFSRLDLDALIGLSQCVQLNVSSEGSRIHDLEEDGRKRKVSEKAQLIEGQKEKFLDEDRLRWTFESAYNVVEVEDILSEPLQLLVKARPPVAGNKAPRKFWLDSTDIKGIDLLRGKHAKRLKSNLVKCLETFFAGDENPEPLLQLIENAEWAAGLVKLLQSRKKIQ